MKKTFFVFALVFLGAVGTPSAVFAVGAGGVCDPTNPYNPVTACNAGYTCDTSPGGPNYGTCVADPNAPVTCNPACSSGQVCDTVSQTCVNSGFNSTNSNSSPGPATFKALAPIPGLTDGTVAESKNLAAFFNNLYKYLIGLAAVLAVIQIIRGGLEISTESVYKHADGKKHIMEALFGLLLVLSPVIVFSIINPSILNLSVSLPGLDTKSGGWRGGSSSQNAVDETTGCSVTGDSNILQIAICPSGVAAQKWGQGCSKGILSEITPITKNADGTPAINRLSCTRSNKFEFIDVHTSSAFTGPMARLQPLAIASNSRINGSDTVYQTNGSDAIQFASICGGSGWETCISDDPSYTISHTCAPLPKSTLPADAPSPATCYTEILSCRASSFIGTGKCSKSPSWTPFQ